MPYPMFTPQTRERLREALIARARSDDRITAAAVVGSASVGREDRWSDIDLALSLAEATDMPTVMADWTEWMETVKLCWGMVNSETLMRQVLCPALLKRRFVVPKPAKKMSSPLTSRAREPSLAWAD